MTGLAAQPVCAHSFRFRAKFASPKPAVRVDIRHRWKIISFENEESREEMTSASSRPADMVLALPIKGESFMFRRAGRAVLVDGGWERDNIADVLARHFRDVTCLDVVLCTHGDADHAGGLPGLLNQWAARVRQVWLPGRWVDVVPQLVLSPAAFLESLVSELDSQLQEPSDDIRQMIREDDQPAAEISPQNDLPSQATRESSSEQDLFMGQEIALDGLKAPKEPEWFILLRQLSDPMTGDVAAKRAFASTRNRILRRRRRATETRQKEIALYWLQLIDTAKAIRGIAVAAIKHKIPTRWFDFEEFARTGQSKGGVSGFLVPINAVEQASPPTSGPLYRFLTRINEESLVFLAPSSRRGFGVLFCGDSPLGDGAHYANSFLPRAHNRYPPMVITASHHGSESNSVAYRHLNLWLRRAVLLRAGGSAKQPGRTFLEQHDCLRLCAQCPRAKRTPRLTGVIGCERCWPWRMMPIGTRCDCS